MAVRYEFYATKTGDGGKAMAIRLLKIDEVTRVVSTTAELVMEQEEAAQLSRVLQDAIAAVFEGDG